MNLQELYELIIIFEKYKGTEILCIKKYKDVMHNTFFEKDKYYKMSHYDFSVLMADIMNEADYPYDSEHGLMYVWNNNDCCLLEYKDFTHHFELMNVNDVRKRKIDNFFKKI